MHRFRYIRKWKNIFNDTYRSILRKNSIECRFFNYNTRGEDIKTILNNIEDRDSVVLLDNADLYMSDEISNLMHKYKNVTFIISIKRRLRLGEPYKLFRLSYNDLSLSCEDKYGV